MIGDPRSARWTRQHERTGGRGRCLFQVRPRVLRDAGRSCERIVAPRHRAGIAPRRAESSARASCTCRAATAPTTSPSVDTGRWRRFRRSTGRPTWCDGRTTSPACSAVRAPFVYEEHPAAPLWSWDADEPRIRADRRCFAASHVDDVFPGGGATRWQWSLGAVVTAVAEAPQQIVHLGGYAEPFWRMGGVAAAAWMGRLPNSFALLARRTAVAEHVPDDRERAVVTWRWSVRSGGGRAAGWTVVFVAGPVDARC